MMNAIRAISKDFTALIFLLRAFLFRVRRLNPNVFRFRLVELVICLYLTNFLAWFRGILLFEGVSLYESLSLRYLPFLSLKPYLSKFCLNFLFVEVDVFGPFALILCWWAIFNMFVSIIPLLFNQSSNTILHSVYEASLIYVIFALVKRFFVIVYAFLKLSNIADFCLLKVYFSLTMGGTILYFPLEAIFCCFDDTLNHLSLLPVTFVERILRMIFKGAFPTCFSSLKRSFISPRFIKQDAICLWVYFIIFLKLALEVGIVCDDGC